MRKEITQHILKTIKTCCACIHPVTSHFVQLTKTQPDKLVSIKSHEHPVVGIRGLTEKNQC